MAKVTVYVTDDQLERLKAARGVGKGGVSKAFQAFLESATAGEAPAGRYDYARKLMPVHAAIERHRRRLARKVAVGGPPADGGPVAAALTLLLYRELLRRRPELESALEKEFIRFGLDELVATETEGIDLLAEPEPDDSEVEVDEDDRPMGAFTINLGDELRGVTEALRHADLLKENLRAVHRESRRAARPPRPPRESEDHTSFRVSVSVDDDPRQVLTGAELATFTRRHEDWSSGHPLTPSQMETVRELLLARSGHGRDQDEE